MTPFAWSGLLGILSAAAFGLLVFIKTQNRKLGRAWLMFSSSVVLWSAGVFWIGVAKTAADALIAWRFAFAFGVLWMPAFFLQFICAFCCIRRPKTLGIYWGASILFFPAIFTSSYLNSPQLTYPNLFYPRHEWIFTLFVGWWFASVVYSHVELALAYRSADATKRNQIKYFFLSTMVGYTGGTLVYLPHFGINVYPWGNFSVPFYPLIMTYAILKFDLMEMRILIRKTALLIGVYAALLLITIPLAIWLRSNSEANTEIIQVTLMSLVLSIGPFLYAYFIRRSVYFQEHTIAGITHELKSPLAAIESALDILNNKQSLDEVDAKNFQAYLEMIQRNSKRLTSYVNELLHTFDPASAGGKISKAPFDLVRVAHQVADVYSAEAKDKRVELHREFPAKEIRIDGDAPRIEQVFSNVLANAVKFTDGGKISITVSAVNHHVEASVTDTGVGIPHEELPYVFDRFFQGKRGRNRKGTGLGLAIAKMWVEAHGGKIWAESDGEGKGTRVTFTLPVREIS